MEAFTIDGSTKEKQLHKRKNKRYQCLSVLIDMGTYLNPVKAVICQVMLTRLKDLKDKDGFR